MHTAEVNELMEQLKTAQTESSSLKPQLDTQQAVVCELACKLAAVQEEASKLTDELDNERQRSLTAQREVR